jgi:glutamine amidotransferase
MIHIVDYGLGNVQAFTTLFRQLGIPVARAVNAFDLKQASRLILPGVGHFDHAMQLLNASGMRLRLQEMVVERKVPILGICVGMQMLAESSDEGLMPGLNWVPGRVRAFRENPRSMTLPLPHMGWNDVKPVNGKSLFDSTSSESPQFYFLHSYYFDAYDVADVAAIASYGFEFHAAVSRGNIHGVQFHPEKSHHWGVNLLKKFAEI